MMMRMIIMTVKNDDYKQGYREGFLDGFHAARDNESLISPNIPTTDWTDKLSANCKVCGIYLPGRNGLVLCNNNGCPNRSTIIS
jgi:hypothetical protein